MNDELNYNKMNQYYHYIIFSQSLKLERVQENAHYDALHFRDRKAQRYMILQTQIAPNH